VLQLRQDRLYVLGLLCTKEGRQGDGISRQRNRFRRQVVRKSQTLEQAFFLGLNGIDLCNFDLSQLIKGSSLTMPCTINKNGLRIKTCTLINTRANSYIFIDYRLAEKASQFLDVPIQTLPVSYDIRAFNSKKASLITQYIEMNLHMNGRKQSKQPMLLV
jgi:hypothetical protein